jgi:ParB-like chromosome segregation protein Spo0J
MTKPLIYEQVQIDKLIEADYNPRTYTHDEFDGLKASLASFGFVDPVIANKRNDVIVGGHMRVAAWRQLGHDMVPVVWVDLDEKQERKLNVVLNSQKISGTYNELKLAEMLESFKTDDDYSALRLGELEPADGSDPKPKDDDPQEYLATCPECQLTLVVVIEDGAAILRHNE